MGHYAKRFFNQSNIRKGLIIEYLMNGNVNDTSGNGFNGTPTGITYVSNRKGNVNSAAEFIENTDSIVIGTTQNLFDFSLPFSINCWVYVTSWATTFNIINHLKGSTSPLTINVGSNASYLGLCIGSGNATVARQKTGTPTSFFLNTWRMITVTYNGQGQSTLTNFKLYEDGVLKTATASSAFGNYMNTSTIGKIPSNTTFTHKGYIDDYRYWNREITQSEINKLFIE